jgi:hypothetical protein
MGAINAKTARQKSWPGRHPRRLIGQGHGAEQHTIGPVVAIRHHIDAVVYPITHVHIPMPRLPKQRLITGAAPAVSVAGRFSLAISLSLNNFTPCFFTMDQQAANESKAVAALTVVLTPGPGGGTRAD